MPAAMDFVRRSSGDIFLSLWMLIQSAAAPWQDSQEMPEIGSAAAPLPWDGVVAGDAETFRLNALDAHGGGDFLAVRAAMHGVKVREMRGQFPRFHFIFMALTAFGGADDFRRIEFMDLTGRGDRAPEGEAGRQGKGC